MVSLIGETGEETEGLDDDALPVPAGSDTIEVGYMPMDFTGIRVSAPGLSLIISGRVVEAEVDAEEGLQPS